MHFRQRKFRLAAFLRAAERCNSESSISAVVLSPPTEVLPDSGAASGAQPTMTERPALTGDAPEHNRRLKQPD